MFWLRPAVIDIRRESGKFQLLSQASGQHSVNSSDKDRARLEVSTNLSVLGLSAHRAFT